MCFNKNTIKFITSGSNSSIPQYIILIITTDSCPWLLWHLLSLLIFLTRLSSFSSQDQVGPVFLPLEQILSLMGIEPKDLPHARQVASKKKVKKPQHRGAGKNVWNQNLICNEKSSTRHKRNIVGYIFKLKSPWHLPFLISLVPNHFMNENWWYPLIHLLNGIFNKVLNMVNFCIINLKVSYSCSFIGFENSE